MKKISIGMILAMVVVFGMVCLSWGSTLGQVKALVEKAEAYFKANGKDKALAEFNNPNGQFTKDDLYVFAMDLNGLMLANGGNPKLAGINMLELKDPTGKFFIKEHVKIIKTKGSGWVDYSWTNPQTKKVQPKKAWIQRVEGTNIYIGCGIFQ